MEKPLSDSADESTVVTEDIEPKTQTKEPNAIQRIEAVKNKEREGRLAAEAKLKAFEEKQLAEQGKYSELAEQRRIELEAQHKLNEKLLEEKIQRDQADQRMIDEMLTKLPEDGRPPSLDGLPIMKQKEIIESFMKVATVVTDPLKVSVGTPLRHQSKKIMSSVEEQMAALDTGELDVSQLSL